MAGVRQESSHPISVRQPLLAVTGLSKRFGGVQALREVSFDVRAGEIHALVGENGAGKSTLVKLLGGAYQPDEGRIVVNGRSFQALSPRSARELGLAFIYQEFNLIPWLSVIDNIFLGRELTRSLGRMDERKMRRHAKQLLGRLGVAIDLDEEVYRLSIAERQRVEIAKALTADAKVLIMDEPSAVLAGQELEQLFTLIRALRKQGVATVYISHRLAEVFSLADRATVLKDGRVVGTRAVSDLTSDDLVRMMVGRDVRDFAGPEVGSKGEVILQVRDLQVRPQAQPLSLDLHAGEVLGLAGLVGSGRTRLARALSGLEPGVPGRILKRGKTLRLVRPRDAIRERIALVPEDRLGEGLLLPMSVMHNVGLCSLDNLSTAGVVGIRMEKEVARKAINEFDVRPRDANKPAQLLSGGNQQKVVLAKWLVRDPSPEVVILDEPTRGVDVGAKAEIYQLMSELAQRGAAILMISSELPELLALSDRVLVMKDGSITARFTKGEATEEAIMRAAVGYDKSTELPAERPEASDAITHRVWLDEEGEA